MWILLDFGPADHLRSEEPPDRRRGADLCDPARRSKPRGRV